MPVPRELLGLGQQSLDLAERLGLRRWSAQRAFSIGPLEQRQAILDRPEPRRFRVLPLAQRSVSGKCLPVALPERISAICDRTAIGACLPLSGYITNGITADSFAS